MDGKKIILSHETIKDSFGEMVYSVWNLTKSKNLMGLVNDKSENRYTEEGDTLSELNPDTVKRCIEIWSDKGDLVLDPFLNRGTTPIMSAYLGRIGLGNDVVQEYVDEVLQQKERLLEKNSWAKNIHISCGDARKIDKIIKEEFVIDKVEYVISSPPFWNVEKYVSAEGQISDISDYNEFLRDYEVIVKKLYDIIKPDKFATFIVNDFRRNGKYIWFSGDTIKIFLKCGFELHDIVINVVRTPHISGIGDAIMKRKQTLKYHEYVLTFKRT